MPRRSPRFCHQCLQAARRGRQLLLPIPNIWLITFLSQTNGLASASMFLASGVRSCGIRAYLCHPVLFSDVMSRNPTTIHFGIEKSNSVFALPLCIDSDDFYNNNEGYHFLQLFIQEKLLLIWLPNHDVHICNLQVNAKNGVCPPQACQHGCQPRICQAIV
jgi:hypothetical protein